MGLDTAQGRMSVFQVPGIMTNPFPTGAVIKADRQQISDVYAGLAVDQPFVPPNKTSWTNYRRAASAWTPETKKPSDIWIPETKKAADNWPNETEIKAV